MADQITTSLAQAKVLVMQGMAGKAPRINAENQHWEVWDNTTEQWVDTGYSCNGAEGLDGHSPYINSSGYWVVYNDGTQQWVTTDVVARGVDGVSPTVTITEITRGHRVKITDAEHPNGQSFDVTNGFNGLNGTNGADGHSPYADATTGTWWVYDDATGLWVDSHVTAVGTNGKSPYINSSGYWVFWNDSTGAWVTTNYKAAGTNGEDGHSPYIGANGHWFAWSTDLDLYDDTGVHAQGDPGTNGYSPVVSIVEITGGHRVTITDEDHPQGQSFDVMDGQGGSGGAVDSVNGQTGVVVLGASDVGALPANTPIPPAVTVDSALSPTSTNPVQNKVVDAALDGKGTYSKPSGGIPKTDLASDVQTSLGKADTALQQHQSLAGYATESYVQQQIAAIPDELPAVTASDNWKFLRVVSGTWAAQAVPSAESNSFGGGS